MADTYLQYSGYNSRQLRIAVAAVHKVIRALDPRRNYPAIVDGLMIHRDNDLHSGSYRVTAETRARVVATIASESVTRDLWTDEELILTNGVNYWASETPAGDLVQTPLARFSAGEYPLILSAGQSNCVGMLPGWAIANWPVAMQGILSDALMTAELPGYAFNEWQPVQPYIRATDETQQGTQLLAMLHRLRMYWPRVAGLHYAQGGTSLEERWGATGDLWLSFARRIQDSLAAAPTTIVPWGFHWDQGENDANETYGALYEANLTSLIARVRAACSAPNMRVVIREMPLTYLGGSAGATLVHNAQIAVAAADPLVRVLPASDFYPSGEMHATEATAIDYGGRVGDLFASMT